MESWRLLQQQWPTIAIDAIKFGNGLLLLFVLLVPMERLFALRPQKLRRPGFATDLAYYFLSSLLPGRLLAWPLAMLVAGLAWLAPRGLVAWPTDMPWWLRLALGLVVAEIGFYWGHRLMHQQAWLWRFHAIHHSAEQMDWLVNTRAHPIDLVFTRACGYLPLYLLGLAQAGGDKLDTLPLLVSLVGSLWGYVIHANVRWRWPWLEGWIATPAFHHWHHERLGADPRGQNYAGLLPWVDKLFGSYRVEPGRWPERYGIEEPMETGLASQLIRPLLRARPEVPDASYKPATGP